MSFSHRNSKPRAISLLILLNVSLFWTPLDAAPGNPSAYTEFNGGLVELKSGSFMEGSLKHGGLQPDYILDTWSPEWKPLLSFAHDVGISTQTYWNKIDLVLEYVTNKVLPGSFYDNAAYMRVLDEYRQKKQDVPLSRYIAAQAGVCREYALITHMLLQTAGIPNRLVYATERIGGDELEDHAFVLVDHDGEQWVVDAYLDDFNGYRLKDLLKETGPQEGDPVAPMRVTRRTRHIIKINDYPRYWVPK